MPRISLAFVAPDQAVQPLRFGHPLPLDAAALTRVAPAVAPAGIHLGVWRDANGLSVWGTVRALPRLCFVLEVAAPGLLVVKHQRGGVLGKFVNVAVVEGDQIKVIDERASHVAGLPAAAAPRCSASTRPARGSIRSTFWSSSRWRCAPTGAVDRC